MRGVVLPGATIGIVGGGQLGRMIALSARQLGYGVVVLAPSDDAPAAGVADHVICASFEDLAAAETLARGCDVVTYEFENVPEATAARIEQFAPLRPGATLLGVTQDRVREHELLHRLGIPTAPGVAVSHRDALAASVAIVGTPCRLKSALGGYDGGGQWRIASTDDLPRVQAALVGLRHEGRFLLESEMAFEREASVIVARGTDGDVACFPVFENEHVDGILVCTRVPARISSQATARMEALARALAEDVGLVGTLTVECFVAGDEVRVNELAPRVHNSGHLTVEACGVSQFEQHVRAICGLPLGDAGLRRPAAMVNLLGTEDVRPVRLVGVVEALRAPDVHLHVYGKSAGRARRKMGHVTATAATPDAAEALARRAAECLRFVRPNGQGGGAGD